MHIEVREKLDRLSPNIRYIIDNLIEAAEENGCSNGLGGTYKNLVDAVEDFVVYFEEK